MWRTVRDRSRELAKSLGGSRTVRPRLADGPPLYSRSCPERLFLWLGLKGWTADGPAYGRGRSAGHLTFLTRDIFASGGLHVVKGGRSAQGMRTVRPSNFKFVQRRCIFECSECLNCGRSANRTRTVREGSNGRLRHIIIAVLAVG